MSGINHFVKMKIMADMVSQKKLPKPKLLVAFSGIGLIAGGSGILLWMVPVIASLGLALFLIITAFTMHNFWKLKNAAIDVQMNEMRFFMMNIALAGALILLATLL